MRLIDADVIRNTFVDWLYWYTASEAVKSVVREIVDILDEAPTIDAEPVRHGRWEWYEYWGDAAFRDPPDIYDAGWACSVCGTELLQYLQSHFHDIPTYVECASDEKPSLERCPCCGAKMDAKEDNHA